MSVKTEALAAATIEVSRRREPDHRHIAAGAIGMKRRSGGDERWYSADLQWAVLSRRSDPRSGETVTPVDQCQPLRAFARPVSGAADFKVTEHAAPHFRTPAGASQAVAGPRISPKISLHPGPVVTSCRETHLRW